MSCRGDSNLCLKVTEKEGGSAAKAHQVPEGDMGQQIKPLNNKTIASLFLEIFLMAVEALKAATEERWPVINDAIIVGCSGFSHS